MKASYSLGFDLKMEGNDLAARWLPQSVIKQSKSANAFYCDCYMTNSLYGTSASATHG